MHKFKSELCKKLKISLSLYDDSDLKIWAKSSYGKRDSICRRWNCFQRAVNLGVIEFKDIKNFSTTSTKDSQGTYEDNTNFCKERYADAKLACEVLFEEAYYKQKFDGVLIYMPVQKNVKLNNLKKYAKHAGEDVSGFTAEEWNKMSTPEAY